MVNGFLTLYFGMEVFPFFSDRPVGRIYYSTLTAGCKGLRVQRAMELLKGADNDKVQSIAEMVGYGNNPQYFSHVFKKATGMTPSAYIKFSAGGNLS